LEVVAAEHVLETIDIPVVPVAPAPQRGWTQWFIGAESGIKHQNSNPIDPMEFLSVTFDLMYHEEEFNTILATNRQYDF
jgi:hypothetical protein